MHRSRSRSRSGGRRHLRPHRRNRRRGGGRGGREGGGVRSRKRKRAEMELKRRQPRPRVPGGPVHYLPDELSGEAFQAALALPASKRRKVVTVDFPASEAEEKRVSVRVPEGGEGKRKREEVVVVDLADLLMQHSERYGGGVDEEDENEDETEIETEPPAVPVPVPVPVPVHVHVHVPVPSETPEIDTEIDSEVEDRQPLSLTEDVSDEEIGPASDLFGNMDDADIDTDTDAWREIGVVEGPVLRALCENGFVEPLAVQQRAIPVMLGLRHFAASGEGSVSAPASESESELESEAEAELGSGSAPKYPNCLLASETGSGKTLVFVLSMLVRMIREYLPPASSSKTTGSGLFGLIIVPTRELAEQVANVVKSMFEKIKTSPRSRPVFYAITLLGGRVSIQKQRRLIRRRPHVIVGTPGRLLKLMGDRGLGDLAGIGLERMKMLVVDEADRIVRRENTQLLQALREIVSRIRGAGLRFRTVQKICCSATLTLQASWREGRKGFLRFRKYFYSRTATEGEFLDKLLLLFDDDAQPYFRPNRGRGRRGRGRGRGRRERVRVRGKMPTRPPKPKPKDPSQREFFEIVDLTTETHSLLSSNILDAQIKCASGMKFAFLYYMVSRFGGKKLIFCNSVNAVKQVVLFLRLLCTDESKVAILQLHGVMQQGRRFKSLGRFRTPSKPGEKDMVLVTTDVASRGIDVPDIVLVLHFQLPRSPEVYVHRCGRTGRVSRNGMSVALVDENDTYNYTNICRAKREAVGEDTGGVLDDLALFPIDSFYLNDIRTRVRLTQPILKYEKRQSRSKKKEKFRRQTELDDDDDEFEEKPDTGVVFGDDEEFEREPEPKSVRMARASLHEELRRHRLGRVNAVIGKFVTPEAVELYRSSGQKRNARFEFMHQ